VRAVVRPLACDGLMAGSAPRFGFPYDFARSDELKLLIGGHPARSHERSDVSQCDG